VKRKMTLKDIELRLISELMKNSRKSDRELARALAVSQPTITRIRNRLEKEGIIKEYTIIPDFPKIGYRLLALTFVKLKKLLRPEEADKARDLARQRLEESRFGIVMLERGLGLGFDGVIISFYEDFAAYMEHKNVLKQYDFLGFFDIETFLISLDDKVHYRPLTFSTLAKHLLTLKEREKAKTKNRNR
jgi:DNA-binding Lrp family transcriptional regulator